MLTHLWGITLGDWMRVLRSNCLKISPRYWIRAAFVSVVSAVNSLCRLKEQYTYGTRITNFELSKPPLFILGHWGSGTTLLHSLFALDKHFARPNLYQISNPHTFLSTESIMCRLFGRFAAGKRVFDNVAVSLEMPMEDEFAICIMCHRSPYGAWSFPRREHFYDRYLTLEDVPDNEITEWKTALVWFMKKLSLKSNRPLILKSPPHTARIRVLLEMFPDARFVHIHRNPYSVYQSTRNLYEKALPYFYLQRPNENEIEAGIIRRYSDMYDAFFSQRCLIPEGQFHEIGFEELENDPIGELQAAYEHLQLGGFDAVKPTLRAFTGSLSGYQKNKHTPLDDSLRDRIACVWKPCFEHWGYGS